MGRSEIECSFWQSLWQFEKVENKFGDKLR